MPSPIRNAMVYKLDASPGTINDVNEPQRQRYLHHLGIDSYSPRWILPNAVAPKQCIIVAKTAQTGISNNPEHDIATGPEVPTAGTMPTDGLKLPAAGLRAPADELEVLANSTLAPVSSEVPNLLDKLSIGTENTASNQRKQLTPSNENVPKHAEPAPRFALSIWRIQTDLVVIDSRQVQLALPTDHLLANIVSALGYRLSSLPKAEVLRWPLIENRGDQSEAQAKEMVQTYLSTQLARQAASYLLLMGCDATNYIIEEPLIFDDKVGGSIELPNFNATAIVVPSLAQMLQEPSLKALTWKAIQPLRRVDL